jgi:hypothetical protein
VLKSQRKGWRKVSVEGFKGTRGQKGQGRTELGSEGEERGGADMG